MPSLKDLRNRISPRSRRRRRSPRPCRWWRRRSCAVPRWRPRRHGLTPSGWNACWPTSRAASDPAPRPGPARRQRPRPDASSVVCTGRARPVRRVQLVDRPSRARACAAPHGQGKTVKIICVGKKGYEQLRRQFEQQIVEVVDLREVKRLASSMPSRSPARSSHVRRGRVRRLHPVLLALPLGDQPDRRRRCGSSRRKSRRVRTACRAGAPPIYEYEPEESDILEALLPRNIAVQVFRALLENAASEQGARMSAMDNATRNAGDMIKQADIDLQPVASGDDHQGTDRDHLGRRGALTPCSALKGSRFKDAPSPAASRRLWFMTFAANRAVGHITQVIGAVVDVKFDGAPARDSERARDHQQRQPSGARSCAASRREHRALHRHGHLRGPDPRPGSHGHRQPDHGAGRRSARSAASST